MATKDRYIKQNRNISPIEAIAAKQLWIAENAENNEEEIVRLKRNLKKIITEELTPTQRDYLTDIYFRKMRVKDVALKYGVNKSSVSRAVRTALAKVEKYLKYSF